MLTHCENCFFLLSFEVANSDWVYFLPSVVHLQEKSVCLFYTLTWWQRTIKSLQSLILLLRLNKPNPTNRLSSLHAPPSILEPLSSLSTCFFCVQKPKTGHAIPDIASPVNKINHLLQPAGSMPADVAHDAVICDRRLESEHFKIQKPHGEKIEMKHSWKQIYPFLLHPQR